MHVDILIFAVIAAFLVYRLNSVLGTRHGEERKRDNVHIEGKSDDVEKILTEIKQEVSRAREKPVAPLTGMAEVVDAASNSDGRIETGLMEIADADAHFEINSFMTGARAAFTMIVEAYARGDRDTLKPLLSPKLYADFSSGIAAREKQGHVYDVTIHRIKRARIIEAHLGGTMAYVTVDYDVEETAYTKDRDGHIIDGSPERVFSVEDIWTFSRDTRSEDPNWILIETRTADQGV